MFDIFNDFIETKDNDKTLLSLDVLFCKIKTEEEILFEKHNQIQHQLDSLINQPDSMD